MTPLELLVAGVLILASGVPGALADHDLTTVLVGYVIMRLAMVAQWLRAAADHPQGRSAVLRYACGIGACQLVALSMLALPPGGSGWGWVVFIVAELAGPGVGRVPRQSEASTCAGRRSPTA